MCEGRRVKLFKQCKRDQEYVFVRSFDSYQDCIDWLVKNKVRYRTAIECEREFTE